MKVKAYNLPEMAKWLLILMLLPIMAGCSTTEQPLPPENMRLTAENANNFVDRVCGKDHPIVFVTGQVFTFDLLYQAIEPCIGEAK